MAKKLTASQKKALEKGKKLMQKAVSIQREAGKHKVFVNAGGMSQGIIRYKMNLAAALKKAAKK